MLDLEDDAARANWGGEWHMPTKEQCDELFNTEYVTNEWVENYNGSGINGRLFTSVSNGNTLFTPAAGGCSNGEVEAVGTYGNILASTLGSESVYTAGYFYFESRRAGVTDYGNRCSGMSVRGVIGGSEGPLK